MKTIAAGNLLEEFAPAFYPQPHAITGASSNSRDSTARYLQALLDFAGAARPCLLNPQKPRVQGKATVSVLPVEAVGADATEAEDTRRPGRDFFLGYGLPVHKTKRGAARAPASFT